MMTLSVVMMNDTGQLDKNLPLFLTLIPGNIPTQAHWSLIFQNFQSRHLQRKNFPGDFFLLLWELAGESRQLNHKCHCPSCVLIVFL